MIEQISGRGWEVIMSNPKGNINDVERLLRKRELLVACAKISLARIDFKVNKILLQIEYDEANQKVKSFKEEIEQLKNSPTLAEHGKGGYLAELDMQLESYHKQKELREEIKKQIEIKKAIRSLK